MSERVCIDAANIKYEDFNKKIMKNYEIELYSYFKKKKKKKKKMVSLRTLYKAINENYIKVTRGNSSIHLTPLHTHTHCPCITLWKKTFLDRIGRITHTWLSIVKRSFHILVSYGVNITSRIFYLFYFFALRVPFTTKLNFDLY